SEIMAEEVSALAMEEESNPAEVIESETPPPNEEPMSTIEEEEENNENINDENEDTNNFAEDPNVGDAAEEDAEKLDFGDDSDSDDEGVVVTIGDIKTNLPLQRRGFPVQKLDPNVTPNVQGKNIFDVNPTEFDDRPWLKSGANIADYFNFGFTEETWNEYAEKQRLLRLEYPSQAEVNRIIMDELREKHGNKDAGVPIVMPVHNSGGRNLVTIQSVETKPPVKIGFPVNNTPINTTAAENLPPMIRNLVTGVTSTPQSQQQQQQQQQSVQIPTVNLTTPVVGNVPTTPTKPIVVDLTKPPPNFNPNIPPPNFNTPKLEPHSPNQDIKPDLPPGIVPSSSTTTPSLGFNPNVPPPNFPIRLPATNLTNLSRPMNPMNFNRPPQMGNYYNPMGGMMGGGAMNLNGPPPTVYRQHSNDGPPGMSSLSRTSMDGPPGTEVDMYRSSDRRSRGDGDRERRKRDSDESDDDRRRRRHDRGSERDRERDSRETRKRDSRDSRDRERDRDSRTRRQSSRDRSPREGRKRRTSRDRDERSSRRHKEDEREASSSSSSRRHRRDKDDSKQKSSSTSAAADLDEGPPGV
uniref:Pre-mRNA 3'-end-processing factor FIP1 n=1 Tax=Panagrolaimus sp. ES5 TaxID=591445 RepID=A0AC34G4C8_9BILA